MKRRGLLVMIAGILVFFVLVSILLQNICEPAKNPVSAAVSSLVEQQPYSPAPSRAVDPLSYDGLYRALAQWFSRYCAK